MSREHIYTTPAGQKYAVGFISCGMGTTDFSILPLGTSRKFDLDWKPRIVVDTETGIIKRIPEGMLMDDVASALANYRAQEHEEFLSWCREKGLDPACV